MYYEKGKSYGRCLDENRTGFGASDVHRIGSSNYVELIMGESSLISSSSPGV